MFGGWKRSALDHEAGGPSYLLGLERSNPCVTPARRAVPCLRCRLTACPRAVQRLLLTWTVPTLTGKLNRATAVRRCLGQRLVPTGTLPAWRVSASAPAPHRPARSCEAGAELPWRIPFASRRASSPVHPVCPSPTGCRARCWNWRRRGHRGDGGCALVGCSPGCGFGWSGDACASSARVKSPRRSGGLTRPARDAPTLPCTRVLSRRSAHAARFTMARAGSLVTNHRFGTPARPGCEHSSDRCVPAALTHPMGRYRGRYRSADAEALATREGGAQK